MATSLDLWREEETRGLDQQLELPIFTTIKLALFEDAALAEEQISKLVNLTQLVFRCVRADAMRSTFRDAHQARLKSELQQILLGPDYWDFGPMWGKRAQIITDVAEWAACNHEMLTKP